MNSIEGLEEAVLQIESLLGNGELTPTQRDPRHGPGQRKKLAEQLRDPLLRLLGGALDEAAQDRNLQQEIRNRVARLLGDAAGIFCAVGDEPQADTWLKEAVRLGPEEPWGGALEAARREAGAWVLFCVGRHHAKLGQDTRARLSFWRARRAAKDAALRELAQRGLDGPVAVKSAPGLVLFNGCGATIHGRRDERPDGTYISTYFLRILFVPVLPLCAYRVAPSKDGGYYFLSRERLGPIARAWQALGALGAASVLAITVAQGVSESATRKVRAQVTEAKQLEAAGDRSGALARYAEAIEAYQSQADVSAAVDGFLRLTIEGIPSPCAEQHLDAVSRAVNGYLRLPESYRGKRGEPLVARLAGCAEQLAAAAPRASLAVLDLASEAAPDSEARKGIDERRGPQRRQLAASLAPQRPADALAHYTKLAHDGEARKAAASQLVRLSPAQLAEAAPEIEALIQAEERASNGPGAARLRALVKEAEEARRKSEAIVEGNDPKWLADGLKRDPGDEILATAAAQRARQQGDAAGCVEALRRVGEPGALTTAGQMALATCHAEAGAFDQARGILEALLTERRQAYQEAQRALRVAGDRFDEELTRRVRHGDFSPELRARLEATNDEKAQQRILQEWALASSKQDPEILRCRQALEQHSVAVPISLELGAVCLQQAAHAAGDDRARHLQAAEQAFLSFQAESEGSVPFHLGLGELYHRLGKPQRGDEELGKLLGRKQPELALGVAHTYRELGLEEQARTAARAALDSQGKQELRDQAALLLSLMAGTLEEQKLWLDRVESSGEEIGRKRDRLRAQMALRDGKREESERLFAQIAAYHERNAESSPAEANNAAIAHQARFESSGDVAHLKAGVSWLEKAAQRAPESAIVQGNLAGALTHLGLVQVLERWVKVRTLAPGPDEASSILRSLTSSHALRAEAVEAVTREPARRRSLDLARRQQLLAPGNPSGYRLPLLWAAILDDTKALAALRTQVEALPPLREDSEVTEKIRAGALDESRDRHLQGAILAARQRLERAQKAGHEPTLAAAWMLLASALQGGALGQARPDPAQLDEMLEAARQAARRWPEVFKSDLEHALVTHAILSAAARTPALQAAWEAERREFSPVDVAYRAREGAGVVEALRQQATLTEALKLAEEQPDVGLGIHHWELARLASSPGLERRAAEGARRRGDRFAIEQRLSPSSKDAAHNLLLLKQLGP